MRLFISFTPTEKLNKLGTNIIPILHLKNLRPKEVKNEITQLTKQVLSWDLNSGTL